MTLVMNLKFNLYMSLPLQKVECKKVSVLYRSLLSDTRSVCVLLDESFNISSKPDNKQVT